MYKYIIHNIYYSVVITYLILSIILKMQGICDITIPCVFNSLFGVSCPGCGLTRSCGSILQLNFIDAYRNNALIYIILPTILYFIVVDYNNFKKYF